MVESVYVQIILTTTTLYVNYLFSRPVKLINLMVLIVVLGLRKLCCGSQTIGSNLLPVVSKRYLGLYQDCSHKGLSTMGNITGVGRLHGVKNPPWKCMPQTSANISNIEFTMT